MQCTVYSEQYTVDSVQYIVYSTMSGVQCTVNSLLSVGGLCSFSEHQAPQYAATEFICLVYYLQIEIALPVCYTFFYI